MDLTLADRSSRTTFFFFNYEGDRYRDFSYNGQVTNLLWR